jgi:SAM-dependent MidA family methyltransferase
LFALRENGLFERAVGVGDRGEFVWREHPADALLSEAVANARVDIATLPRPYCSEVRPLLAPWFAEVTRSLEQGVAWFIDYGYVRDDYYAPQRCEGTLRCHYRHRAHNDPLILPGLQDITAWVDFDALADAGVAAGFALDDNLSQAQFLIAHGLDEVFAAAYAEAADEVARYRLGQEVKRLTLPGEMGAVFQVTALSRWPSSPGPPGSVPIDLQVRGA